VRHIVIEGDWSRVNFCYKKGGGPCQQSLMCMYVMVLCSATHILICLIFWSKSKCVPQQAEVAQGVPVRLRPRIFFTFSTTRVIGCQLYAPAAFRPGEIPSTHFQGLSRPQGTWFCQKEPQKNSPVTLPGVDPGTVQLVAQCLNHYTTPGPNFFISLYFIHVTPLTKLLLYCIIWFFRVWRQNLHQRQISFR